MISLQASLAVLASSTALAAASAIPATTSQPLPSRYTYGAAHATFLYDPEEGGPDGTQSPEIPFQAINGNIVFTQQNPTRICPCADDSYGAKNLTGFYVGGASQKPTLQLFTSSPGAQLVYIDRDLSLRYTIPGAPVPAGANGTSISIFDPQATGDGPPSAGPATVRGFVTAANSTRTYYNGIQLCAPLDSPPRTENGPGPLMVRAMRTSDNTKDGNAVTDPRCVGVGILNSVNEPNFAPYYFPTMTPAKPLVYAYEN